MEINLCDNCIHDYATCIGEPVFGCDDGGLPTDDNVTQCKFYIEEGLEG